jgi:hypothetical protein
VDRGVPCPTAGARPPLRRDLAGTAKPGAESRAGHCCEGRARTAVPVQLNDLMRPPPWRPPDHLAGPCRPASRLTGETRAAGRRRPAGRDRDLAGPLDRSRPGRPASTAALDFRHGPSGPAPGPGQMPGPAQKPGIDGNFRSRCRKLTATCFSERDRPPDPAPTPDIYDWPPPAAALGSPSRDGCVPPPIKTGRGGARKTPPRGGQAGTGPGPVRGQARNTGGTTASASNPAVSGPH